MAVVPGTSGANANARQIYALARQAGFDQQSAITATAIALAETGGSGLTNDLNPNGEYSVGLWQINTKAHGSAYGTPEQLTNPQTNARAAYLLYKSSGGFSPWTTFTGWIPGGGHQTPPYLAYLPQAQAAALNTQDADVDGIIGSLQSALNLPNQAPAPGEPTPGQPSGSSNGSLTPPAASTPGRTFAGTTSGVLGGLAALLTKLFSPSTWWGVFLFAGGVVAVLAGLFIYFRQEISAAAEPVMRAAMESA